MSAGSPLKAGAVIQLEERSRARQLLQAALRMEDVSQVKLLMQARLTIWVWPAWVHPAK